MVFIYLHYRMTDFIERGLFDKFIETAITDTYNTFGDKSFVYDLEKPDLYMELDEIKIVLGPYIVGIFLSFFVLLYECANSLKHNDHDKPISLRMQNKEHILALSGSVHGQQLELSAPPVYSVRNGSAQ